MKDKTSHNRTLLLRLTLLFSLLLNMAGLYALIYPAYTADLVLTMRRWQAIAILGTFSLLVEATLVAIAWLSRFNEKRLANRVIRWLALYKTWNLVAYSFLLVLCSFITFTPIYGNYPPRFFTIVSFYWHTALIGCVFLKAWSAGTVDVLRRKWLEYTGFSFLLCIAAYRIASFLQDIRSYPFTLAWSETSRFYYASLFLSKFIYGEAAPFVVLHPSRYIMLTVPFLLPDSPLWLHRAWQAVLWIGMPLLTTWLLLRRVSPRSFEDKTNNRWAQVLFFVIAFIFLLLGPVYYHLQVPLILILWGFDSSSGGFSSGNWLKNLMIVILASAWAGISRVNWYPVPGMLAALLILLEQSFPQQVRSQTAGQQVKIFKTTLSGLFSYLLRPAAWIILGLAVALAAQFGYITVSGNPADYFATHLSSTLLWYRLLPNPTYPPGILPGIIVISLPLALFIWDRLGGQVKASRGWKNYHPIRLLGMGAILVVFFSGGLVVSTKIGGGSNLHNLDAFESLLLIVTAYFLFDKSKPDLPARPTEQALFQLKSSRLQIASLAMCIVIYALFTFMGGQPRRALPPSAVIEDGLAVLNRRAEKINQRGREILFISNRHLITFNYIPNTKHIPEYERVFLMEMAMAGNTDYLEKFRQDLKDHRFALIINEPLYSQVRETEDAVVFREENNAWVGQVADYIRCYYQEDTLLKDLQIQLFVPDPIPNKAQCPTEP